MTEKQYGENNDRRGQSIVEYILLIAAVIVILLLFFSPRGQFAKSYNRVLRVQGDDMLKTSIKIFE